MSAAGWLLALAGLYRLALQLFDPATARLAALLWLATPGGLAVSTEVLSDSLALGLFTWALAYAVELWQRGGLRPALGLGIAAGLGFWTRPEAAVLPAAMVGAWALRYLAALARRIPAPDLSAARQAVAALGLFCFLVGGYAISKGELSEKLALRRGAAVPSTHDRPRAASPAAPPRLDHPRWDFSAKEEQAARPISVWRASGGVANRWAGGLGWPLAALMLLGACRVRAAEGKALVAAYVALFTWVLLRHYARLGYLSDRHVLTLVTACLPWAAAGLRHVSRRLAQRRGWTRRQRLQRRALLAGLLLAAGLVIVSRPAHASRAGHVEAARWLRLHLTPEQAIYDSRGWVRFLLDRPGYDAWHVRQALTDPRLTYLVLGEDELTAGSERAKTLRAILTYAAEPVLTFGGHAARYGPGRDLPVSAATKLGRTRAMSHGSVRERLLRGTRWL